MRIGIFTFFQSNYGAVLQAYAMQTYIQKVCNEDAEIIDFTTKDHLKYQRVFQIRWCRNPFFLLKYYFYTLWHYKGLKRRIDRTCDFKKKYFNFSKRYSNIESLISNPPSKDIYLAGSDQVFDPFNTFKSVYFLNFRKGKGKKVAYAPSFGISTFTDEIKNEVGLLLKDFDYLTCREQSGSNFIESIIGKNVPTVLDPVFLLSFKEWHSISIAPKFNNYIFIYDLNGGDSLVNIAKEIRKKTNMKIICLTGNRFINYDVDHQIYDAGPAEFVGLIENASYVVTDSFHGTAFSILFEKKFYTYIALRKTSSRLLNLLDKLNMSNRIVNSDKISDFSLIDTKVKSDYLEQMIIYSKDVLNQMLYKL